LSRVVCFIVAAPKRGGHQEAAVPVEQFMRPPNLRARCGPPENATPAARRALCSTWGCKRGAAAISLCAFEARRSRPYADHA